MFYICMYTISTVRTLHPNSSLHASPLILKHNNNTTSGISLQQRHSSQTSHHNKFNATTMVQWNLKKQPNNPTPGEMLRGRGMLLTWPTPQQLSHDPNVKPSCEWWVPIPTPTYGRGRYSERSRNQASTSIPAYRPSWMPPIVPYDIGDIRHPDVPDPDHLTIQYFDPLTSGSSTHSPEYNEQIFAKDIKKQEVDVKQEEIKQEEVDVKQEGLKQEWVDVKQENVKQEVEEDVNHRGIDLKQKFLQERLMRKSLEHRTLMELKREDIRKRKDEDFKREQDKKWEEHGWRCIECNHKFHKDPDLCSTGTEGHVTAWCEQCKSRSVFRWQH